MSNRRQATLLETIAAAALPLLAAASGLRAQDLTASLGQDPKAGLAIYTFDLSGPPKGAGLLMIGSLQAPLPLPPWGLFFLDPRRPIVIAPPRPLDPFGRGRLQFVFPLTDNTLAPCLQALFVDPQLNLRFSKSAHSLVNGAVKGAPGAPGAVFGYTIDHSQGAARKTTITVRGRPGTSVRYRVRRNGKVVLDKTIPIGANGTGRLVDVLDPGAPGDTWSLVYTDTRNNYGAGRSGKF